MAESSSEAPIEGTVHIGLTGTLYDYQVTIEPTHGTQKLEGSTWPCECSNEELLTELRPALAQAFQQLASQQPIEQPEERKGLLSRIEPLGWAGIGLMSAGGLATATGVVLLAVGETRTPSPEDWGTLRVVDLRPAGALALGAGLGAIATGATLFLLRGRKTQPQRAALEAMAPGVDRHGQPVVTVRGRF